MNKDHIELEEAETITFIENARYKILKDRYNIFNILNKKDYDKGIKE